MDQAQSNQTEIAMRSLQLNNEQFVAYFNQHCLALQTNQLNDSLLNRQFTINNQQVNAQQLSQHLNQQLNQHLNQQFNHQLNHPLDQQINHHLNSKFNRNSPKQRISPNQQLNQHIKPILIPNPDQLDKEKLKASGFSLYNAITENVINSQVQTDSQSTNYSPAISLNKQPLNELSTMQPPPPANRPTTSAFRPVARRKDSVYSMEGLDAKRLLYEQTVVDLLNKVRTNEFKEGGQRVKSPKKNYIERMLKLADQTDQTNFYEIPATHLSIDQQTQLGNNFLLTNPFSPPLNHFANNHSSHSSISNSFNHLTINLQNSPLNYSSHDDDDQLPLDMSKPSKTKADQSSPDDLSNKKTKLIKKDEIGQYINKIIAQNQSIIETNEIKMHKRTNARNSTSNLPSNTQIKSKNQFQRTNRSVSVIQPPGQQLSQHVNYAELSIHQNRLNHDSPKLVSALRGQLENSHGDSIALKSSFVNQKSSSIGVENNSVSSATFTNPSYYYYSNSQQVANTKYGQKMSDENYDVLANSFMKKYLTTKAPTIKVTPPSFSQSDDTDCQMLENYPKSSIIKDLLLVNKDGLKSGDKEQLMQQQNTQSDTDDRLKSDQEELSCLVYVCTICKIAFRNKQTLTAHQTHYCKNNLSAQQTNKDLYSEVSKLAETNEIVENRDKSKDALGNILKQHLLYSNPTHTLPKKRKISEPTFPSSQLNNHSQFTKEMLKSITCEESNKESGSINDAVYFSNFGLEAQGQNVARKISVLTAVNRPYFIHIKQPVFEHQHLIDLRQIPGLPAQLNNQQFYRDESNVNLLKSEHNNSVTNLTKLDSSTTTCAIQSSITQTSNSSLHSPVPSEMIVNSNSTNSSHKHIDKSKDYMLISEYLTHYDRKITIKGQLKFDILARTLEEQGDEAEFRQSLEEEDCCSSANKFIINNRVNQISSMPVFVENKNRQVNNVESLINLSSEKKDVKSNENHRCTEENEEQIVKDAKEADDIGRVLQIEDNREKRLMTTNKQTPEINGTTICAAKRPDNLFDCLPKKPCQLICSNLVSPETPRLEKKFAQFSLNGKLYTYLKPKQSTRVTFCCIYTPQPCFVESTESTLSMYSNWQIFPPYESILNDYKVPVLMKCYDSRQWKHRLHLYTTKFIVNLPESSKPIQIEINGSMNERSIPKDESTDLNDRSLHDEYLSKLKQVDNRNGCTLLPAFNWMMKKLKQDRINIRFKLREFKKKFCQESSDLTDRLKRRQRKLSRKTSDEYSINNQLDVARQIVGRKSSGINQPQRIFIFEGGYKSNEDYTYVRGRGRGKYVCTECGIRCKKPSMLRKHIRSHTNLRPYSCSYCTFAFKTKGNLTKHMKSKAHHKKCAELGINPIPTSIDTHTQIDTKALALQEAMERASSSNSSSYLNENYNDLNDADMDDDDSELDDQLDDDQLDEKWGELDIDEDDDAEEEDEEYLRRLNCGDQHLHITGLRLISNNLNQNNQQIDNDKSNSYLDVQIGCLTNYKRLSAFSDIILPNGDSINKTGNDILNKFSIITDVFNSTKPTIASKQDKTITLTSKSTEENDSPTGLAVVKAIESSDRTTPPELISKSNDSSKSSLISVLDSNNNLVTLSRANRLAGDEFVQLNTLRHKHSLIGGVNSNSLASIPECLEEENNKRDDEQYSNKRTDNELDGDSMDKLNMNATIRPDLDTPKQHRQNDRLDDKSNDELNDKVKNIEMNKAIDLDLDGNYKISRLMSKSSELKRKNVEHVLSDELTTGKRLKNDDCNKYTKDDELNKSSNNTTTTDKIESMNTSMSDQTSSKPINMTTSNETNKSMLANKTLISGMQQVDVRRDELKSANYLSHHKADVGGVVKDKHLNESGKLGELNERNSSNYEQQKDDNSTSQRKMTKLIDLNQLSKDSIPKVNLEHKSNGRSRSLPPQKVDDYHQPPESRSNSVNSNLNVSEIEEHEVAHSLLSLSRVLASDNKIKSSIQPSNPIILPIKRKISQEFGLVPYHHGNYNQVNSNQSPVKSPLTTYSDEEVSRVFKRTATSTVKNEKSWSIDDWEITDKMTDRLKEEISRKFSEKECFSSSMDESIKNGQQSGLTRNKSNSGGKLSEKLAEIKRKSSENHFDLSKRLDENEDIHKLLEKVDQNLVKSEKGSDLDKNQLILMHIQESIDRHERILNNGTLDVISPTSSTMSSPSTYSKQPVDNSRTNLCRICNKTFSEESQLKLHEHIHYFERPFRCEVCSVSFRSTGHLQKHIRSVSHQNKLNMNSTFGQASLDNPRPFKCTDCKTSFRIFGHLSKHLRSKIHIGKLEGLGKLPSGLYALMERNRIQLNDLDTTDCETSLQSLRKLAQRLQANGDLPVNPTIDAYSTSNQSSSFICSSAYCESSNDSNLSTGKSIDDKQLSLGYPTIAYLSENSSSDPSSLPVANAIPFNSLLYPKLVTTSPLNHPLVTNTVTNATQISQIPLFNTVLPIDSKLKPTVGLIPNHLIENLAIYTTGHYIPQQQFYDQTSCKHPHHLYPQMFKDINPIEQPLPHGHPLPKPQVDKPESPEIDVLEDSNESSRSSTKLDEMRKKTLCKSETNDSTSVDKNTNKTLSPVPNRSSPKPGTLSSSPIMSKTASPDFSSIKMNSNTCSICSQVFKSAKFLQVHLYSEHSNNSSKEENEQTKESNDLSCKICGKLLDSLAEFRTHVLVHSVPRPFICEKCDAGFSTKEFLNSHLKTHLSSATQCA